MTNNSDRELVELAVDGDVASFGKLCERYYSAMAAIAYAVLGSNELAEDVAQEAFARALSNLDSLKNKEKFAQWLARICRNVANDTGRAKFKRASTEDLEQFAAKESPESNDEMVRLAISKLAIHEKELIVLRYYDNLSYEQISSVLGISKPAINGRLTRAKRKLAEYLKQNGFSQVKL